MSYETKALSWHTTLGEYEIVLLYSNGIPFKLNTYLNIFLSIFLFQVNPNELLASIPLDGSPALLRLIKLYSPLKSLQTLAIEADLSLTQVRKIVFYVLLTI